MSKIRYLEQLYKYQLAEPYSTRTNIYPKETVYHRYIHLYNNGELFIRKGYAWDGASGPTIDTSDSMRGSLVHDALYQLIRLRLLPESYREAADYLFYDILREDGMSSFRAWAWLRAVRAFGAYAVKDKESLIKCAPIEKTLQEEIKFGRV